MGILLFEWYSKRLELKIYTRSLGISPFFHPIRFTSLAINQPSDKNYQTHLSQTCSLFILLWEILNVAPSSLKNGNDFLINPVKIQKYRRKRNILYHVKNMVWRERKSRVEISVYGVFEQFRIREKLACQWTAWKKFEVGPIHREPLDKRVAPIKAITSLRHCLHWH